MKPGDVIVAMLPGAAEAKVRPGVVIASSTYLRERPDVTVGILTTNYILVDWQAASLHMQSCFRAFVLTVHRANTTIIGRLTERDWASVKDRVRIALSN